MNLNRIDLDDDELPATFSVTMTRDEFALLYRLTGHIGPQYVSQAAGGDERWGSACMNIAGCVGNAFNRFYENGVTDVIPRFGIMEIAEEQRSVPSSAR